MKMTAIAIKDHNLYCGTGTECLRMALPDASILLSNYSDLAIAAYPNTVYGFISKLLEPKLLQQLRLSYNNPREWFVELLRHAKPVQTATIKDFTFSENSVIKEHQPIGAIMTETSAAAKEKKQRNRLDRTQKIKILCAANPRREGTHGYKSFQLLKDGMDVAAYLELGGRMNDLLWEIRHKHVELK